MEVAEPMVAAPNFLSFAEASTPSSANGYHTARISMDF